MKARLDNTPSSGAHVQREVEGEPINNAPAVTEKKKTGDVDRVSQTGEPSFDGKIPGVTGKVDAANRERILDLGAAALTRITEAITKFHGMDHVSRDGRPDKYDGGERPATIPKVVARVNQDFAAIKEAAALVSSGQVEPAALERFAKLFDDFLLIHAAMIRAPGPQWKYETEGNYPKNMERLRTKMEEIWALSPAFIGEEAKATAERSRIQAQPADYAPVREAAGKLSMTVGGYYAPDAVIPRRKELTEAVQLFKDNVQGADFVREGGKYSVALWGVGVGRFVSGRGSIPIAKPEAVEKAARIIIESLGLDPQMPIHIHHPGATPARREEAFSIMREAIATRDYIDEPKSGSDYYLRRWSPELEIGAPIDKGHGWVTIPIILHSNEIPDRHERSFKDGTPSRIHSDAENYLWRRGLKDCRVEVMWEPRELTQQGAQALVARLENARGEWKNAQALEVARHPVGMSPADLLKYFAGEITVDDGSYSGRREVVVHVPKLLPGQDAHGSLHIMEKAVRSILDDPASQGTPVRILLPVDEQHKWRPNSIIFGHAESHEDRTRRDEARAKLNNTEEKWVKSHFEYRLKERTEALESFEAGGAVNVSLAAAMKNPGADDAWKVGLETNLNAYFLGRGAANSGWQQMFEKMPLEQRADFLALALRFLDDDTKPRVFADHERVEPLREALTTMRRLVGRIGLEQAMAKNGRQVPEHMAHSDEILKAGLGGRALALAQEAIAEARRAA